MSVKTFNVGEVLEVENLGQRSFHINEIHQFITRSNPNWRMSWGFRNPTIMVKDLVYRFRVSGHHHKGYVYIILDFMDTFTIYYTTLQGKVKKVSDMVYIDMLMETLDINIERIDKYVQ